MNTINTRLLPVAPKTLLEISENFGTPVWVTDEGDVLAILVAGGYGSTMSSNYNLRENASEVLVKENGEIVLTKKRQSYEQIVENFIY
ncbi:TPA: hypothetical protein EYG96_00505 [Candidatus Gracilibacteria bacterium]|nr:hypothetical protein [Candidatus Gracilibacteria bacterium]